MVNNQPEEVPRLSITDAHFHLDRYISSAGYPSLRGLDKMETESSKTEIGCAVANYCFPDRYSSSKERSELRKEPQIVFAYGIHPRTVHSTTPQKLDKDVKRLTQINKSTRTVAVDDCGLDTTDNPHSSQLDKQINYLEKQLYLAVQHNLAVIIHCRGDEELHFKLLHSLVKICPSDQAIHWHWFTISHYVFYAIITKFTNAVFGITPFIFSNRYPDISKFVRRNGLNHLVLESDSPFIRYRGNSTTPYVINYVAEEISRILSVLFEEVVTVTSANATNIYKK